jgi:hypothetical protein
MSGPLALHATLPVAQVCSLPDSHEARTDTATRVRNEAPVISLDLNTTSGWHLACLHAVELVAPDSN